MDAVLCEGEPYESVLQDQEVRLVVAVQELEVQLDTLLATQDRSQPFPVQCRALLGRRVGLFGSGSGHCSALRVRLWPFDRSPHDLEELLRRRLGQIERDLVSSQDLFVLRRGGGGRVVELEERVEEGGSEGWVVQVDEALRDGKVVGRVEGFVQLDQEAEDLPGDWSPESVRQFSAARARCAYLALVAPTGATDGDTLADDQLQDPLEQTRVLCVFKDALNDVEPVRSECDTECLCDSNAYHNHRHLVNQ